MHTKLFRTSEFSTRNNKKTLEEEEEEEETDIRAQGKMFGSNYCETLCKY